MRCAVILLALLMLPGAARAEPVAASDWTLDELPLGLKQPSGLAWNNGHLIVTDLASGRVVRVEADGSLSDLVQPLPTGLDVMGQPTGPYKVKWFEHSLIVSQGWPDSNAEPAPTDHAILAFAAGERIPRVLSGDFWNPYDFEPLSGSADAIELAVVDAGKNALLRLKDGKVGTIHEFPRLKRDPAEMSALSPTEFAGEAEPYEVDAVPTGIAIEDDRIWVALFGGFPFTPKGGAVVSLARDGSDSAPRPEIEGINTPVDLEFTPDGDLLVLEMGAFDMASGFVPGTGRLSLFDPDERRLRPLLDGLDQPTGLLAPTNNEIYVSALSGHVYRLKRAP